METGTRGDGRRAAVLPRVLLVVALVLGLCAMHVAAATTSGHHPVTRESTGAEGAAVVVVDHTAAMATPQAGAQAVPHDHHSAMTDCVLFLSAGVVLLLVLVACAARRFLRRPPWPPWPVSTTSPVAGPGRGPPARHWPRVSLCVIRV